MTRKMLVACGGSNPTPVSHIEELEEIVTMRQTLLDQGISLKEEGSESGAEMARHRIDWLTANIDLAVERQDYPQALSLLSDIQELNEWNLEQVHSRQELRKASLKEFFPNKRN